ncbi:hypothetical protein P170DRAFT_467428 [Aspergillus steynii IBT 23096]|uniref:Uncharacterized protein n=1 Tax=Aspergillus steynii IBT 23096 TaxID=1392250 RepID=A0A2I2FVS0_9EURO|nr:uncharacterized protein P170DRAFT_467428 [Aspergillus steynii IBT 23096]PLB44714.1 hypothetical protein P170DRAFT_467428 [Aspergillus steynii IBT 23096]
MPILDKENRPRGLRMPSLSAIKGGLKKQQTSEPSPQKDFHPVQLPAASLYPTDTVPVLPSARPQEKELPPNPLSGPPSSSPPAVNANDFNDRPLPRFPRVPVPKPEEPAAPVILQETPPPTEEPKLPADPGSDRSPNAQVHHTYFPYRDPSPNHGQSDDTDDPLEDFIPEPEPEPDVDGTDAPIEPMSSEENNGPWTPPDIEPVAAPLNKLHFACYQGHRSMPAANNAWYPLPCMTCQKFDREVRFRCVFCCLRICAGCMQTLQKLPNRSLDQLMETITSPE